MARPVQLEYISEVALSKLAATLGLSAEDIEYVGIAMVEAAASAHPLGARTEAGYLRWSRGIAACGERLAPHGYRRVMEEGAELILSPDGSVAIAVTAGDEAVGNDLRVPKARYPRGAVTRRKIAINGLQLGLFDIGEPTPEEATASTLWMLLHKTERNRLILEIALPAVIEPDGTTIHWEDRIQLGAFGYRDDDDQELLPRNDPDAPSGPTLRIVPRT